MKTWNEERIARLRTLAEERQSALQIAEALGSGLTRCAVIGKCCRLGIRLKGSPARRVKPKSPRVVVAPEEAAPKLVAASPTPWTPFPASVPTKAPQGALNAILGLRNSTCRFPIGEPNKPDFRFCCAPADLASGHPYCEAHAAIAYCKGSSSLRDAINYARRFAA